MKELNTKEIEQKIIACMIVDIKQDYEIISNLTNQDFVYYGWLFDYLINKYNEWDIIDLVLLKEKINIDQLKLDIWDVIEWINTCESYNLRSHIENLKTRYLYKNLLKIANKINNANYDTLRDWSIVNECIQDLSNIEIWEEYTNTLFNILAETSDYIDNIKNVDLIWYSFWLEFLDTFTWWIEKWFVYRIWWWSNVWKSWLLYNILYSLVKQNARCIFFSLENKETFTMKNLIWLASWINTSQKYIKVNNPDYDNGFKFWLNKEQNFNLVSKVFDINKIFNISLKYKPEVIFIDYLQLVRVDGKEQKEKLENYAHLIQRFANKNNIAIIDLSQLSNGVVREWNDWSWNWEFKWSWALKDATDVSIHLYKDSQAEKEKQDLFELWDTKEINKTHLIMKITKNRLWVANIEQKFTLDFNKGGIYEQKN